MCDGNMDGKEFLAAPPPNIFTTGQDGSRERDARDNPNMIKEAAPHDLHDVNENAEMIPISMEDLNEYDFCEFNDYNPNVGNPDLHLGNYPHMQVAENFPINLQNVINAEVNEGVKDYKFQVLENDRSRSTTHTMKRNVLFAMPKKDVPISVVGAEFGDVMRVGLRYTTGAHHNTPVQACKAHDEPNDPGYCFCVPKLSTSQKSDQGHLIVEIPVIFNLQDDGTFSFSVVFRCLNSCHRDHGKDQELVMTLCNINGKVLHEQHIPLRICKNVNRDKKMDVTVPAEAKKRRTAEKEQGPTLKKVKQEAGGEVLQPQASTSAAPFLPPLQYHRIMVELNPVTIPLLINFVQLFGGRVQQLEGENMGEGSSDPLSDPLT